VVLLGGMKIAKYILSQSNGVYSTVYENKHWGSVEGDTSI
jgi:hypothetical protein